MAVYSETRDALVEMVCRLVLDDWWGGAATSDGTTTTLVDTTRIEKDNYFFSIDAELYIRSATNDIAGENKSIIGFGRTTNTLTVSPAFSAITTSGDTYSIHAKFKRASIVEAINLAIHMVAEDALDWKMDETSTTLVADTYEYDIPSGFEFINKIMMADSNGKFYGDPIPPDQYSIIPGGTTAKIKFLAFPEDEMPDGIWVGEYWIETNFTAGRKLRIEGLSKASTLSTDASTCAISPGYLINQAGAFLLANHMSRSKEDPRDYSGRAAVCRAQAAAERAMIVPMQLPVNSKRVRA